MKTIRQLQLEDDLEFIYYDILVDYLRVVWFWIIVWLIGYIFL